MPLAATIARPSASHDVGLERRPSQSYGHHRQASIIHGYQHSRTASFATPLATSPLSPQIAEGPDLDSRGRHGSSLTFTHSKMQDFSMTPTQANGSLSASTLVSKSPVMTSPSENGSPGGPPRRMERMHSTKNRLDPNHHHTQSRPHAQPELKSVGEYALHHLFNSFVGQADQKIDRCITNALGPEPNVEDICGVGVDPAFDQLISALGHIVRQKPKPLIDTLMVWRKTKSEMVSAAKSEASLPPRGRTMLPRRNTEPAPALPDTTSSTTSKLGHTSPPASLATRQEVLLQADRRATVAIYLLCRVLMEIFRQSTLACVTQDMADKLEDIIFGQLISAETDNLAVSPLKMANWTVFSQLLGVMSGLNLSSVADKFFRELERLQRDWDLKLKGTRELESKTELVIMGLKHFQIRTQPQETWHRSCDFMHGLGRFYLASHGQRIKHAYCRILEHLLLPVAAQAPFELNQPKWRTFVDTVHPKVSQMLTKPRHWLEAFPLAVVLLCVSPTETFVTQWLHLLSPLQSKLKDRVTRGPALQAISRLVWTYLYRTTDTATNTTRKIEEVIRLVLPVGKKSYISTDPHIAEPMIQLIRIIGYRLQDLCFRTIIFPMINAELFWSGKELRVDQLEPEKIVIGIRSFLAIMSDLERCEQGRPPFPQSFGIIPPAERASNTSPSFLPQVPSTTGREPVNEDRLSRPVLTTGLSDVAKEHYAKFCEILGKITMICDDTFGGQAVLDEKFSSSTPKTPIAETFSFSRRDEHQGAADHRQGFYDLLHVAVQALPRCLSTSLPFHSLVNLLCTGTAHVQSNIASSSAESLKAIARQSQAQAVTIGFARYIFNFDDRYATMSDGGMLGPLHIEYTLTLYVELLQIWIEEIKRKAKAASASATEGAEGAVLERRGTNLDRLAIQAHVDEVESHGLFFLCSQSRRVRSFAVTVLRLITAFDLALDKSNPRIIHIIEQESLLVMDFKDENLSVAERSRLQRGMRRNNSHNTLMELCSSDISYDSTLWFKIFPNLIRITFDRCPSATTLAREIVCDRLLQQHRSITALSESRRGPQQAALDSMAGRYGPRLTTTPPEVMIEQWKLYLIVACTTLTNAGPQQSQTTVQSAQHARKASMPVQPGHEKIATARSLFHLVIPLLSVEPSSIREAVVVALGSINMNLYKTLLESLQATVAMCNEEARQRPVHQRTSSSPRRSPATDRLRTEITHVYKLTSHFLREPHGAFSEDVILQNLITYTEGLKDFLSDVEIQNDWQFQRLRRHYCGLMEELFDGINRTKEPAKWMTFETRKSAFHMMEDWCGYSPHQTRIRQREDMMRQALLEQQRDHGDKGAAAAMEIEKRNLKTAALSAMAALCGGPVVSSSSDPSQFDIPRMLSWIDAIFSTPSDRLHAIGRRALKNLIVHNEERAHLMEKTIQMCYTSQLPKALESYFQVVSQILLEYPRYPLAFWKILGAALFTLGNEKSEIRSRAAHLLRTLEERQERSSGIQDYEISISDKTNAVYKLAQFEISRRLAKQHSELAFLIFSEFTFYFKDLEADHQRNMVATILPWIQEVDLKVDPSGGPTAPSYMLLANLFEITIKSSGLLLNEVQALWQALATGPHGGNVQLVLNFIISLCLDRREQNFVDYAKKIVVFMSSTPAGAKVVEFLLLRITPTVMVQKKQEPLGPPPEAHALPYLADLSAALPIGNKQAGFALGQLSMILLVDLMVAPVQLGPESVPLLLQAVFILWDHYITLVQEQAREMLVHLIHELVISRIGIKTSTPQQRKRLEDLIESIRRHDGRVIWSYDDSNGKEHHDGIRVPASMEYLAAQVVEIFALVYPTIRGDWGQVTLDWANSCPVRHLACRSFQIFRCIRTTLDQRMLSAMLARLSNTIADKDPDIQTFSMEILTTLKTIIGALDPAGLAQYPQLFWATCACLNTIHEREFIESLGMLEQYLEKVDLTKPETIQQLTDMIPAKWEGKFDGLQPLIYRGLRSIVSLDRTLAVMEKLVVLPYNALVGGDSGLLYAMLANLPRFLQEIDEGSSPATVACVEKLAHVAASQGCTSVQTALMGFATSGARNGADFLQASAAAIRDCFFPEFEFRSLVFLMGLLTNQLGWYKVRAMQILGVFVTDIDMRKPELAAHGPDLISPLLRLLQTEYCPQALEVLDHIMAMPGTPMDKHHIRMSMASSQSHAIRQEFERTQSLFGIPEVTGWSIPMPAVYAATTRSNVHAVFYTHANNEAVEAGPLGTPDVEFRYEYSEYLSDALNPRSHFPHGSERSGTMMSDEVRGDGMGELVHQLDSLDDFFDDDMAESPISGGLRSPDHLITHYYASAELSDANARYEQQTLPLLKRSLKRTESITSFQSGFADARTPSLSSHREAGGPMSPTAFAVPPVPFVRPTQQSRSTISPAVNINDNGTGFPTDHTIFPDGNDTDEIFSEDEQRSHSISVMQSNDSHSHGHGHGRGHLRDPSFSLGNMIRPFTQGTRSGMRLLTGGGNSGRIEKDRFRDPIRASDLISNGRSTAKSPKVPKVPASYLQSPPPPMGADS